MLLTRTPGQSIFKQRLSDRHYLHVTLWKKPYIKAPINDNINTNINDKPNEFTLPNNWEI